MNRIGMAVTNPDGVLVAVVATHDEAKDVIFDDVLKQAGENGVPGQIDPLFSFIPPELLTSEQAAELQRAKDGIAEYYGCKIERLTE